MQNEHRPVCATCRRLEKAARAAVRQAYAPTPSFVSERPSSLARARSNRGCNVENAAYGLCNCAERTALFNAVAAGERTVRAVVVYTPTAQPTAPCGACRQVINEFARGRRHQRVCHRRAPRNDPRRPAPGGVRPGQSRQGALGPTGSCVRPASSCPAMALATADARALPRCASGRTAWQRSGSEIAV